MFNFAKLKTPHLFPLRHAITMAVTFAIMTEFMCIFHAISTFSFVNECGISLLTGVMSVVLGTLSTATIRGKFNLIQTGRVVQWVSFWLATSLSVGLASYLLADNASVQSSLVTGAVIFACSFGFAYAVAEIPWRGRTWLPMKRKR